MSYSAFDHIMAELQTRANPGDAVHQKRYHKVERIYLGLRVPDMTAIAKAAGKLFSEADLLRACRKLWATDIHDARITTGKILHLKQISDQQAVWQFLDDVKNDLDAWAIADALAQAAHRCLQTHPHFLDKLEADWVTHLNFWIRRAALVNTLYLAKSGQNPARPLTWAATYVPDREWFIQKAIAWWLRELSKHNPELVQTFLDQHGQHMKGFARREAAKYLSA